MAVGPNFTLGYINYLECIVHICCFSVVSDAVYVEFI